MPTAGKEVPTTGTRLGIFVVSLAVLLLQIALTRLLSVVLWYHFAFVAISLAMLGLALAGIALYLIPSLLRATPRLLPWYCRGAALSMTAALAYVAVCAPTPTGHDLFAGGVVALYLVLLLPFTLAGFAVSATLAHHARHIGPLYARDLAGAALGCLLVVPLLDALGAPTTILVGAGLLALGGACYRGAPRVDGALTALLLAAAGLQHWTGALEPTAMHGIPDEDLAAGTTKDFAGWNSHSRIVVTGTSDWAKLINIDGHATTGVYRFDRRVDQEAVRAQLNWLGVRAGSLPYVALDAGAAAAGEPRVLLIGPGGGLDLLNGIYWGAGITGVELNGLIHSLMSEGAIAEWAGRVYDAPGVRVVHDEARSYVRRSPERYDLIQASMIDTWAATASGAFALAENALYTVEAFADYREHLTERGVVHFARWSEDPPRQSLRVLALIAAAMHRRGDDGELARHVIVLEEPHIGGGPPMASLLWANRPLDDAALARVRAWVEQRQQIGPVKVLCWPGERHDNALSRFLHADDRERFLADYPFDVRATTDDRPFFFHTAPTGAVEAASDDANEQAVAVLDAVLRTVAWITALAFLLPLALTLGRRRLGSPVAALARLAYFAALGVGFMLVEIPLLQRFGLYMGHPTWSLSVVLGSLLLGAGCGGMSTARVPDERLRAASLRWLATIVALLLALHWLLPSVLLETLRWSFAARAALTAAVLAPVGFALGTALPLGVRRLHGAHDALVPWAWGINGATSVLASVLAIVLGMSVGFSTALLVGVGCYAAAALLSSRLGAA